MKNSFFVKTFLIISITINNNLVSPSLTFENVIVKHLNYSRLYHFEANSSTEYIFEFLSPQLNRPPRVTVESIDATTKEPLMVVARQPKQMLSWQLPLLVESESGQKVFYNTSRTLCHDILKHRRHKGNSSINHDNPIVTVSTASLNNVSFSIIVDYEDNFYIKPSREYKFSISPSEPRYFYYNFETNITEKRDSNYDTVILEVFSDDEVCTTVSIQNASCPVFDLNQDITFRGFYETINKKGGITIPKYKFPHGFYVVFVAKGDDMECTGIPEKDELIRTKNITLIIKPSITYNDYVNAVFITLGCIAAFYFIFGISFFFCSKRTYIPREMRYVTGSTSTSNTTSTTISDSSAHNTRHTSTTVGNQECLERSTSSNERQVNITANPVVSAHDVVDSTSLNEDEYDVIPEAEHDKEVRLGKSVVYLCDLARKDPIYLSKKSYLYLYNVLTIALFYALPVVQLVVTYQKVLNNTGQQDLCYYNFLCAHPLGLISDFNHLFSNIGYVLLGFLFLFITYRRARTHNDRDFDRAYGIPQHYGMFYAMGVALVMEGVLSGSYHVCPNQANFQFDSSFMYIMAVLCMVKLYQNRHPDINATAYNTFGVLAVVILLGMIGILEGNMVFRIFFVVVYLTMVLYISAQVYYMGCWRIDRGLVVRTYNICVHDFWSGPLNVIRPTYKARMTLLVIANFCNWGLAFVLLYFPEKGFALFLLAICMANTLLYFTFYIVMKYMYKERVNPLSWLFLTLSMICAVSAMYFFLNKSISWTNTPAVSRQYNQECKLLRFYDFHDIWHFLSAIGMFFTFMCLLTLDDDLSHTHHSKITVF